MFLITLCFFNFLIKKTITTLPEANYRNLWEEKVKYNSTGRSDEEKESLEKCENSDYKYFIHFVAGNNVIFEKYVNKDNAVYIYL